MLPRLYHLILMPIPVPGGLDPLDTDITDAARLLAETIPGNTLLLSSQL